MFIEFDAKNKRHIILVAASVLVVAGGLYAALSRPFILPNSFLSAWQGAGVVSAEIVRLMGVTNGVIEQANAFDLKGDTPRAIALIRDARANNVLTHDRVVELTGNLQRLTESLREVSSVDAQRAGYRAVAAELSLVSEFIVYTERLNLFFDRVEQAVTTGTPDARKAVDSALADVNERARRINELNDDFLGAIKGVSE